MFKSTFFNLRRLKVAPFHSEPFDDMLSYDFFFKKMIFLFFRSEYASKLALMAYALKHFLG